MYCSTSLLYSNSNKGWISRSAFASLTALCLRTSAATSSGGVRRTLSRNGDPLRDLVSEPGGDRFFE